MRVLMLIPQVFYSTRGTPLSAYHRTRELLELGYEVEILTYAGGDDPPDLDVLVHRSRGPHFLGGLKQGPSYLKIWYDLLFACTLVWLLLRRRYDLLYGHEEAAFMAAWLGPLFRRPFVYDMHSSLPLQIRDWNFSQREWVVGLFRWVERFTLKRARAVVAISPGVAEAARQAVPDVNVVTIVNRFALEQRGSTEAAAGIRRELGLDEGHRVVLYTGSFVALQALDLLVRAVPAVIERVPQARFVLVGGRDPEMGELVRQVKEAGLEERVLLVPARPQAEMPDFMAAADVLVSPRVQGINPPGKLFSYLSSDRPVVATDTPVHNQILDANCALLTSRDEAGLAEGLIRALTDEATTTRLTAGAREILATKYGPEARAEAYTRLLELCRAI